MELRLIFSLFLLLSLAILAKPTLAATDVEGDRLNLDWIDQTVAPGDNFYAYANATWQKNNPIPGAYSSWGTFYILDKEVRKRVHDLLIKASQDKSAKPGSIEQKIGDFYYSGMDEKSINQVGVKPLETEFERIKAIKTISDIQNLITDFQLLGVTTPFDFTSMQDFANSADMIGAASQSGLGLPDRDYYLKDTKKFKVIRQAYINHIQKMLLLLGDTKNQAINQSGIIMEIETALAKASMSKIEQRDPHAIYHMMDTAALNQLTPQFDWHRYFAALQLPHITHINMAMPLFFKQFNLMLQSVSIAKWQVYFRWHLLDSYAPYLSKEFVQQNFQMVSVLSGAKKLLPRWQRVVATENGALGFAIGKKYVHQYFPAESKQAVLEIVSNIRQALRDDIKTLPWMSPATRKAAINKLNLMIERVGYPDKWWDYSSLAVNRDSYVDNIKRANAFLMHRDHNKIGKPIDKTEWAMTPQTVNAYYDPSMNNINLPAGILQPPFFDRNAPAAINYGAIGYVIGHEMTHGFDDQGAQFDERGNLKNWWTAEDLKKFQQASQCIMQQYSNFKVTDELQVQGKLVMGEAAADLGGLILAYRAFHDSKAYKTARTIAGLTPDQQFFIGFAHVEAANTRPEQLHNLITNDPHPPWQFRVNGTVANMPEFQKAFHIHDTSPMVNQKRCVIW